MCKASIESKNPRGPIPGERVGISTSNHGLGAFHPKDVPVAECVVCVKNGGEIVLHLPELLRTPFGHDHEVEATFVETPGSMEYVMHDLLIFPKFPEVGAVPLAIFAGYGIEATLKTEVGGAEIIEELKRKAITPVPVGGEHAYSHVLAVAAA